MYSDKETFEVIIFKLLIALLIFFHWMTAHGVRKFALFQELVITLGTSTTDFTTSFVGVSSKNRPKNRQITDLHTVHNLCLIKVS